MAQITTLQPLDFLKNSRSILNQNFLNLNTGLTALSVSLSALSAQGTGTSYPTRNIQLSAGGGTGDYINDFIKIRAADVFLGTLSPLLNGNITLSANNGYIKLCSDGPGTQLIDSLQNNIYGGNWLEFYRINSLSSADILEGTAYTLKDLPLEAPAGPWASKNVIDSLVLNGNDNYTSLYFASSLGSSYTNPSIYIPSVANASTGSKIELNGPAGILTQQITVGGQLRFNPDNFDGYWTNPNASFNINTGLSSVHLSASSSILKTYADDIWFGTTHPLRNGNITLSSNNGYVIIDTDGPGLQIKDNVQGTQYGGNWVEFYRTNAASGIFVGTAYSIGDSPSWPTGHSTESFLLYGSHNDSSLYFSSYPDYNQDVPAIYIPSINNDLAGYKTEILGHNGVLTRKITVGGQYTYAGYNTSGATSGINLEIYPDAATNSTVLSGVQNIRVLSDSVFIGTTHPLRNGNITLSANNGYTIIESDGPGLQIKDNVQGTEYGGTWIEFYRTNAASGIFTGTSYTIQDSPSWPTGHTTEALLTLGSHNDSSLFFSVYPDYNQDVPAIYIPSINNDLAGYKTEILGRNGVLTRKITVGGQYTYAGYNISGATSSINFEIYPDANARSTILSGGQSTRLLSDNILIGTTNPLHNGNITLSANNGYVIVESDGPGLQIKDNLQGNNTGGTWAEFYRTNAASGVFTGTAYTIKDVLNFPIRNSDNESIVLTGNTNNTGIYIASVSDYSMYNVPGVYIPSVNNSLSGYKVQVTGRYGLTTPLLNVGGEMLAGDTHYNSHSAINLHFGAKSSTHASTISASQNLEILANSYIIATKNPLLNGNITLSANNGYTIIDSDGPGLQIKDNLHGNIHGGTWIEFYRTNAGGSVFNGTAYSIVDVPGYPLSAEEMLAFTGTNSKASILIASEAEYSEYVPGVYIPSRTSSLSGFGVQILGSNGLQTRSIIVGNNPYLSDNYNDSLSALSTSATNLQITAFSNTNTIYLSTVEATTTLQIGSVSAINFADNSTQTTAYTGEYTPAVPSNWNGAAPTTIQEALDRIAATIKTLNGVGP